ncbi:FRG domain-containing protein [Halanaerobium congolense]|uniref:FRG domain-containing protein n=1 Tax=Halanaerobium congolense TaxID=54121 RepID=A0A4R8GLR6_9FIRM|nr:FRG domain-containing protein [Halanaerobium congolense]TDP20693.1 FRG domain-containing protein [Halanaerobium congolense]TDX46545.1 FRG domain-containing protein [Halanaerobium congolense]
MSPKIYSDIFEAIRHFESNSPLLNLKSKRLGYIRRKLSFNLMQMPNGKMSALPKNMFFTFYRGENDNYDSRYPCKPSIFRGNPTRKDVMINRLKIIDFSLILKTHPKVIFAENDGMDIHYDALAQHYELKTDLLDLSSDIAVAAFFATHVYNSEESRFTPRTEGVGCIRSYMDQELIANDLNNMKLIGLQPFKRPGVQCAFGIKLDHNEDFSNMSNKVLFKQKPKYNKMINRLFCHDDFNKLIPPEDDVSEIAENVKNSKIVSKEAVSIYCDKNEINKEDLINNLSENGYSMVDSPIYKLSRQRRRAIKRRMKKEKPYGDAEIRVRACCYPK